MTVVTAGEVCACHRPFTLHRITVDGLHPGRDNNVMTDDSAEIRSRLKNEIADPFVTKFRLYSLISILSWPFNYLLAFLVLRYAAELRASVSAAWALVAMFFLAGIDTVVFATLIRGAVEMAKQQFLDLFPIGSGRYYVAMEILSGMGTPATGALMGALMKEGRPGFEPSVAEEQTVAPETTPQVDDASTDKEDLIDLNAVVK